MGEKEKEKIPWEGEFRHQSLTFDNYLNLDITYISCFLDLTSGKGKERRQMEGEGQASEGKEEPIFARQWKRN